MSSKSYSLLVSLPGEEPARHDLSGDVATIGRGPDNDIQVLVSEVSVKHGEFRASDDGYSLVDIGSTNGTKVNGQPVGSAGKALSPMDKILLGETIDAYFVPSAVLEATPVAELIESIESSPKATPGTAPVAVAAKPAPGGATPVATPAVAVPASAAPGATTVRLDQVKPGGGPAGPVKPPAAAPAAPAAAASPAAPKLAAPAPAAPASPATPKIAPPSPGAAPAAPAAPAPGGAAPAAPKPIAPVPLKRPDAGGQAPSVPLPKSPPKPGE